MATSENSTSQLCLPWTSSPDHLPANPSALPEVSAAGTILVTSGRKWLPLLKHSGPVGCLLKIALSFSSWDTTGSPLKWKITATPSKRSCFRLAPWGRRMKGCGPGLSVSGMFPTPQARDYRTGGAERLAQPDRHGCWNLNDWAAAGLLPTPCEQDMKNSTLPQSQRNRDSLPGVLLQAGCPAGGLLNPEFVEWMMDYPAGWTDLGEG